MYKTESVQLLDTYRRPNSMLISKEVYCKRN